MILQISSSLIDAGAAGFDGSVPALWQQGGGRLWSRAASFDGPLEFVWLIYLSAENWDFQVSRNQVG